MMLLLNEILDLKQRQIGMLSAVGTYIIWGILPIYWNLMEAAGADEILAHRICWSFAFMVLVLTVSNRWDAFKEDIRHLWQNKRRGFLLLLASAVISMNWLTYIWAINHHHVIDTSIGYYINPLVTVLFGVLFFRERLTPSKKVCTLLAVIGIAAMTWQAGELPWVAVVLALTFAIYGALKKELHMSPFSSITAETLFMLPIAVPYVLSIVFSPVNHFHAETPVLALLLMGTGVVTAVPLVLFSYGANLLPLNVLGFFQYISPTINLLLGIFFFNEPFGVAQLSSLGFIWTALVIFTLSEGDGYGKRQQGVEHPGKIR